ncbi:MAG TPA: hypothetical protein ENI69_11535 [Rhodospirillales bacterium]|nr:hypothetical protein [Rhodospirillales bacterium]
MSSDPHGPSGFASDKDLAQAFTRCFRGPDGVRVIEHLRQTTLCRALGPAASDALLRHLEGQRQLVARILSLIERGRSNADNDQLK